MLRPMIINRFGFAFASHEGRTWQSFSIYLTALMLILTASVDSSAQETKKATSDSEPIEQSKFLDEAKKYVIESPSDRAKLVLNEKSLLNWTNPVRQQERGAVYIWSLNERPYAIGSLFTYEYENKVFSKHEFHSLSTKPLKSSYDGKLAWTPKTAGIEWRQFKDAPDVASTHNARLLQFRQLCRPFRGELIDPKNERTELRLVSRPLITYSAPKQHVLDGALFSLAVATDPEVLILIEAFEEDVNGSLQKGFRYGFARFHYWNLVVYDGDTKVWEAPLDRSHETNQIGAVENIGKVYNSYHPKP